MPVIQKLMDSTTGCCVCICGWPTSTDPVDLLWSQVDLTRSPRRLLLCACTPRSQAIGAIARLEHKEGGALTINVEYNQLDPLLRSTVSKDGDVNDATGFSPYPGK